MVYGIIIFEIHSKKIIYTNFFFSDGNDEKKKNRVNLVITKTIENYKYLEEIEEIKKKNLYN